MSRVCFDNKKMINFNVILLVFAYILCKWTALQSSFVYFTSRQVGILPFGFAEQYIIQIWQNGGQR